MTVQELRESTMPDKRYSVGKCAGLHLWIDEPAADTQYQMRIWRNFGGMTFCKLVHDRVVSCETFYYRVSSWDYPTAFVHLRNHFGLWER